MSDEKSFRERVEEHREKRESKYKTGRYGRVRYTTESEIRGRLEGYIEVGTFVGTDVAAVSVQRSNGNETLLHLSDVEKITYLDDPEEADADE